MICVYIYIYIPMCVYIHVTSESPRRTALEHGAAQVIVVARRHGTICPKANTGHTGAQVVSKATLGSSVSEIV